MFLSSVWDGVLSYGGESRKGDLQGLVNAEGCWILRRPSGTLKARVQNGVLAISPKFPRATNAALPLVSSPPVGPSAAIPLSHAHTHSSGVPACVTPLTNRMGCLVHASGMPWPCGFRQDSACFCWNPFGAWPDQMNKLNLSLSPTGSKEVEGEVPMQF